MQTIEEDREDEDDDCTDEKVVDSHLVEDSLDKTHFSAVFVPQKVAHCSTYDD